MENEFRDENSIEETKKEEATELIPEVIDMQTDENEFVIGDQTQGKKTAWWKIALAVVCCVALLGSLTVVVLQGMGISLKSKDNTESTGGVVVDIDNVKYKDSYTVSDEAAVENADKVVAQLGDRKLTNGQLQIMFWMQVEEFCQYYGYGYFDYTKPLDTQYFSEEEGITWQQYFIELTVNIWQQHQILSILAESENYESIDEYRDTLEQTRKDLEEMAKEGEFESADAMIKKDFGAACTIDDYIRYIELRNVGMLYLSEKYEEWMPDEKSLEAYYTEHEAEFKKNGTAKDSGSLVDVRHILVQLDDVKAEDNGKVNYTEEQWAQCEKKAQDLLDKWKSGEATEISFAKLANENSKDGGSNTKGGLYQQVAKGMMVEAFDAWIFDESRAKGDTGIVKTEFGYHIMYFVGSEAKWISAAKSGYLSDCVDELIAEGKSTYPISINYDNAALTNVLN